MENEVNTENKDTTVPQQDAKPATPDLSLNDLAAVKSIIEVAVARGAFKAVELEAVGKSFNKLNAFLEAVSSKKE